MDATAVRFYLSNRSLWGLLCHLLEVPWFHLEGKQFVKFLEWDSLDRPLAYIRCKVEPMLTLVSG
jgi:hypothetical protein